MRERLKRLAKFPSPILLKRRRPDHDRDVSGVKSDLQNVFDEPLDFIISADKSSILVEIRRAQMTAIKAIIKNRNIGKKTVPKLGDKFTGRAANGNDQIRLPFGTTPFQVLGH